MAKTAVEALKDWFNDELTDDQKREVVGFLYSGKGYLRKGLYAGRSPD